MDKLQGFVLTLLKLSVTLTVTLFIVLLYYGSISQGRIGFDFWLNMVTVAISGGLIIYIIFNDKSWMEKGITLFILGMLIVHSGVVIAF